MNAPLPERGEVAQCFCELPVDELRVWAERKYCQGMTTQTLMAQAQTEHERELVAIVALFDVPEDQLSELMGNVNMPEYHIMHCREYFKDLVLGAADH